MADQRESSSTTAVDLLVASGCPMATSIKSSPLTEVNSSRRRASASVLLSFFLFACVINDDVTISADAGNDYEAKILREVREAARDGWVCCLSPLLQSKMLLSPFVRIINK